MKKLLLILVLCLSTIGLAGCGSSKVTLDPKNGKYQMLEVGKDIAEGNYVSNEEISYAITTQGSLYYDMYKQIVATQEWPFGLGPNNGSSVIEGTNIQLTKGDFLFVIVYSQITLSKN